MKKLIMLLLLLVSGISFSDTCKWIKKPNIFVTKEIELIKKSNLKGKVYCDLEHDFMTYYVGIDNLEVGLVYNMKGKLNYENTSGLISDFENDILKLIPNNIPKKNKKNILSNTSFTVGRKLGFISLLFNRNIYKKIIEKRGY